MSCATITNIQIQVELLMSTVNKFLALSFVFLVLSSFMLLSVNFANVCAVSKPSVPQFTIKLADYSYDVPPSTTTTTDPYTGKETTITKPGYHVKDVKLEVTIKNQPFTPYTNAGGYVCNVHYSVQVKGHFEEKWDSIAIHIEQSKSQYTVISRPNRYADGSQLDFRVLAEIGYVFEEDRVPPVPPDRHFVAEAVGDWSRVQTFTIPGISSLSPPSQTTNLPQSPTIPPDNNQPQLSDQVQPPSFVFNLPFLLWVGAFLFVGVAIVVVMLFLRRQLKFSVDNNGSSLKRCSYRTKNFGNSGCIV